MKTRRHSLGRHDSSNKNQVVFFTKSGYFIQRVIVFGSSV